MKTKAFIYIIIAGVLWGTSGIFAHHLGAYGLTSLHMTAVRGSVAFVCMLGYVLIAKRDALRVRPTDILIFLGCGATMYGAAACYFTAMQMTSVSTAVVLMYTAPIFVMIFSVSFLGEKFTWLKSASVGCMLVGCVLVSGIIGGFAVNVPGILVGLASGLTFAGYSIFTKIAMQRGCDAISTTLYSFFFMALIAVCVCEPWKLLDCIAAAPVPVTALCIGVGVVTYVAPYFLYTLSLRDLPAGTASALSIVEPMAATVFSCMFLQEKLTWISGAGIVLILLATVLLSRTENGTKKKED